jgi:translation elongation factor aEF-1 beta
MELNVAATVRIMPVGPETDLNPILKEIDTIAAKHGKLHSKEIVPIAFGLKSINAIFLLNDNAGGMDQIEAALAQIQNVGSVEITDVNRL